MEEEKVIQIHSVLDTTVSKTMYLTLTNTGKIFKSYDLETWDIICGPKFEDTIIKLKETSLYGERSIK